MGTKRITLFAGHYGSGKTNIAVNYARDLKRRGMKRVAIADLDIVNPYFRTKDSAAELRAEGIDLVVSEFANSNVDFPAMPKEIYALVAPPAPSTAGGQQDVHVVMDIGGDDRGALALGRYVPDILAGGDYEMLAVVNAARPLTPDVAGTVEVLREIEAACRLPFTGLVNNTNLGQETRAQDVLDSLAYADGVAAAMGVPLRFTCADARLAPELEGRVPALFPLQLQRLYYQIENP